MASYLITGSSRGLGLAFATALAARPATQVGLVIASARSSNSTPLNELVAKYPDRVKFVQLDAGSAESAANAASEVQKLVGDKGLDVLINNAGVMPYTPDGIHTMNDLDATFHANVTSVHIVTSAFIELLRNGSKKAVLNISTTLGSVAMSPSYSWAPAPSYKITKAALNMLTVQYAQDFAKEGFKFVAVTPGWVKTDLGSANADLTPEQSAQAVLEIVDKTCEDPKTNGTFQNVLVKGFEKTVGPNQYDGAIVPW